MEYLIAVLCISGNHFCVGSFVSPVVSPARSGKSEQLGIRHSFRALQTSPPVTATFVFQILDESIHSQAALLHLWRRFPVPSVYCRGSSEGERALHSSTGYVYIVSCASRRTFWYTFLADLPCSAFSSQFLLYIYLCVEEYIVGILFILFTFISAFLRRLHLLWNSILFFYSYHGTYLNWLWRLFSVFHILRWVWPLWICAILPERFEEWLYFSSWT